MFARSTKLFPLLAAQIAFAVTPASAGLHGVLEAPVGFASQVSNVQGWAYTTNPGAELVQPFEVYLDGRKVQEVPCCSDRADVREAQPGAPLRTGFSGVLNWSREAIDADGPVEVEVVLRDTTGAELRLTETIELYALSSFPFARSVGFASPDGVAADGVVDAAAARCRLSNVPAASDEPVAEIACRNLVATRGDGSEHEVCEGEVRFTWDKASQGFRQSSFCEPMPRWIDHGDGTATDTTTGLMWELKSGVADDGVDCPTVGGPEQCDDPHHVDNLYQWSGDGSPSLPVGSVFARFLARLNSGRSASGTRTEGCFAGYCDWRIPTVEELRGIAEPCDGPGCATIPGPTAPYWHWTSTQSTNGGFAWDIHFADGEEDFGKKQWFDAVRAVRGAAQRVVVEQDDSLLLVEIAEN